MSSNTMNAQDFIQEEDNNMLNLLVVTFVMALMKSVDQRTRRSLLYNPTAFKQNVANVFTTLLSIRDSNGYSSLFVSDGYYNISEYNLPKCFNLLYSSGKTYLRDVSIHRCSCLEIFEWSKSDIITVLNSSVITRFLSNCGARETDIMSITDCDSLTPMEISVILRDFGIPGESCEPVRHHRLTLDEISLVVDDRGRVYEWGQDENSIAAYICGVRVPSEMTAYLREVPKPTSREVESWFMSQLYSKKVTSS